MTSTLINPRNSINLIIMNLQGYISSGILELYVHGLASQEEAQEVEEMAALHPEVREELEAIRMALEQYALAHATPTPLGLKEKILERIHEVPKGKGKSKPTPAAAKTEYEPRVAASEDGRGNWAGSIAWLLGLGLLGACAGLFLLYQQSNAARQETIALQAEYDAYKNTCLQKDSLKNDLERQLEDLRHWGNKPIAMSGTPLSKDSYAVVYQNAVKKTGLLNVVRLPEPPTGKQYQLWAIVKGKPADMGVFEVKKDSNALQTVPYMEGAAAFAVTLEPRGGVQVPTLEQMYVVGAASKG